MSTPDNTRSINLDDTELFPLIPDNSNLIDEVFRQGKYRIAISMDDERISKITDFTDFAPNEYVVIEDTIKEVPKFQQVPYAWETIQM